MNNLAIAQPWLLLLLPLPLLVLWLVPPYRVSRGGLQVPFIIRLSQLVGHEPGQGASVLRRTLWRWGMLWFCWGCVVLALARPQLVEPPLSQTLPVRDLLLAVDLSGSMETRDFTDVKGNSVDRLSAVKEVLDDFLALRKGDRVGLIFFGSAAFVQAPFTQDLDVVRQLLEEAQVKMAGTQTAFGDALGLAINVFDRSTVKERVLIALTDGNDTSSLVPPGKAASIARDKGIVIHTVAVGDPKAAGEDALDEATLKQVAAESGGLYSHAADRKQLAAIYSQLNKIETQKVQTVSHRPRRDVYWWPLGLGLILSMSYFVVALATSHPLLRVNTFLGLVPVGLFSGLPAFHFIRPLWLLALLPALYLWWLLRKLTDRQRGWRGVIAPHLLRLLWREGSGRFRFGPLQWVCISWLVAIVAIAGPTWTHAPSPFADDTAALALVINVSPSMETEDIQPSRLQRATQKVHDLLAARGKAKTSLIAYAGSAHLVMPATEDAAIIDTFAAALSPQLMPLDGDEAAAALKLADASLTRAGGGSIVWITDAVSSEQAEELSRWRRSSATKVTLWPPLLPGSELDTLHRNASAVNPVLVRLAADDSDVASLVTAARFAPTQVGGEDARWAESGYWLVPLLAVLMLVFFRRGWLVSASGGQE